MNVHICSTKNYRTEKLNKTVDGKPTAPEGQQSTSKYSNRFHENQKISTQRSGKGAVRKNDSLSKNRDGNKTTYSQVLIP